MKTIGKILILVLAALSMTACGAIVRIQPLEVGVVSDVLTGELKDPIGPGSHFLAPGDEVTIYSTQQQACTLSDSAGEVAPGSEAIQAVTSDGQEISLDVTVLYAINPAKVNLVHQRWQNRYTDDFVRPTVRAVVREMVAGYTARDIYSGERANLEEDIRLELETRFDEEGLVLDGFLLRAVDFSLSFSLTAESEAIATQNAPMTMTAEARSTATPIP